MFIFVLPLVMVMGDGGWLRSHKTYSTPPHVRVEVQVRSLIDTKCITIVFEQQQ